MSARGPKRLSLGPLIKSSYGNVHAHRSSCSADFYQLVLIFPIIGCLGIYHFIEFMIGSEEAADSKFSQILTMKGISLNDPKAYYMISHIFKDGAEFPEFFNEDLDGSSRTIKELTPDAHSNIRVIYFEVLRLAETEDDTFLINLRRKVFSPGFSITFTQEPDLNKNIFSDFQFKRFFAQFLNIFGKSKDCSIEELIHQFPIMDQVFIHILRTILITRGVQEKFDTRIPTETVFNALGAELGLDIVSYGNCWKFEDGDMICYEGPNQELYLVYTTEQLNKLSTEQPSDSTPNQPLKCEYTTSVEYVKTADLPPTQSSPSQIKYVPPLTTYISQFSNDPIISYSPVQNSSKESKQSIHTGFDPLTNKYIIGDPVSNPISYTADATAYTSNLGGYAHRDNYQTKQEVTSVYGSYNPSKYTSPSYSAPSSPYTNTYQTRPYESIYDYKPIQIDYSIYQIDERINSLVDKYLKVNPEDIINSPSIGKVSAPYQPIKPSTHLDTYYSFEPSTKYTTSYRYEDSTKPAYTDYQPFNSQAYTSKYQSYGDNPDSFNNSMTNINLGGVVSETATGLPPRVYEHSSSFAAEEYSSSVYRGDPLGGYSSASYQNYKSTYSKH